MRLKKTGKIIVILMAIMCFVLPSAEAKKKSKSNASFMINAGGGLGLIVPGFDIYYIDWSNHSEYNAWSYINFGAYFVGNFGISFDMGKKKKWSLGPAIQLGYKVAGGPFFSYSEMRHNRYDSWFADDVYGWNSAYYKEKGHFMHAFIADLCVAIKGNPSKSARFVAEGGFRFSAMALYDYTVWKDDYNEKSGSEWEFNRWRFMFGPSAFIGADAYVSEHLMLTPGLRVAAAFGPEWISSSSTITINDDGVHTSTYSDSGHTHVYIDIAFEMKINWYGKF